MRTAAGGLPPRVSVIVPSAERLDLLEACLGSLVANGPRSISFEVIVILNFAPGPGAARLENLDLDIRLVPSPVNLGLAGAGNRGRALARGELLVLLHDDAEVEPGWLEALVSTADRHPEAGAIGGLVLSPDRSLQNAGMILWRDGTTSPPWTGATPEPAAFPALRAVDYCGTSSLLIRVQTWDAAGGLDERFFPAYYVDVDLAMKVRRIGQVVLYQPLSVIRHHRGASGELRFRRFVSERNRQLFLATWREDLERQEPRGEDEAAAVARALQRSVEWGESARSLPAEMRPSDLRAGGEPGASLADVERRHLEMEVTLLRDYRSELVTDLNASEAAGVQARELLAARDRELADAEERFARDLAQREARASRFEEALAESARQALSLEQEMERERARLTKSQERLDAESSRREESEACLEKERAMRNESEARHEKERAKSEESEENLARITSLRWWKLYVRILPLLKRIR